MGGFRFSHPGLAASVFWLALFLPLSATAQDSAPGTGDSLETGEPIEITAEKLQYLRDQNRYIADGDVNIVQGDLHLKADHVILDNQTGRVEASGNVVLRDAGDILSSDHLDFNLQTKGGVARPGHLFIEEEHFYIDAERMEKGSEQHYELRSWSATSCERCMKSGNSAPAWRLRGSAARVDLGEYLVARNVVFYIKDVPVMYMPYLIFPIKTERQSGFLIPRLGYSTLDGLKIEEAFFWAIGPSQDATVSLDYRSLRGIGGEIEYRYKLSRGSEGKLHYAIFDDRITDTRRTSTTFRHTQRFTLDAQARLDVRLVSDIDRFRDLSRSTSDRVRQSLVSTFVAFQRWENQEVYLAARLTRDLVVKSDTTLQRLPQVGYSLREYRLGRTPLYAGLDATATHFWREKEDEAAGLVRAKRLDFFPRLWTRLNLHGVVLTPRAGFRETWYSRTLDSEAAELRAVEILDVSAHTRLYRVFGGSPERKVIHRVEPSVIYEYVPFEDQDHLPKFDDVDQLPRKNLITYSITNRMIQETRTESDGLSRREWVFLKVTQSYDIHRKRIRDDPGPSRPYSNLRSEVVLRPMARTTLDLDAFYNLYRNETVSFNSDLKLRIFEPWTIGLGQRLTRKGSLGPRGDVLNPLSQTEQDFWFSGFFLEDEAGKPKLVRFLSGETQINLPWNVMLSGRAYYDVTERAFAEIDYGFRYLGQCWGIALEYQDLFDRNEFSFLITVRPSELSGSTSFMSF